jgi:hypothetical protein
MRTISRDTENYGCWAADFYDDRTTTERTWTGVAPASTVFSYLLLRERLELVVFYPG